MFSNCEVTLYALAYNAEIPLGNLHDRSPVEILNGPERKRILDFNQQGRMHEIEFCQQCLEYDL